MNAGLINVFDPLCGWCYGFSPVMMKLRDHYEKLAPMEVWSGGMITGLQVRPFSDMADYIRGAFHRVEEMTGVKFEQPFLEGILGGGVAADSEPPSRALHAARAQNPALAPDFAHGLQLLLHVEGRDLNQVGSYEPLCKELGLDWERFRSDFDSAAIAAATQDEFNKVSNSGIRAFPTLLLRVEERYFMISQGYRDFDSCREIIDKVLSDEG